MTLEPTLDAAAVARRFVAEHASGLPVPVLGDAQLLVSELVANAVLHGRPNVTLRVRVDPPGIGVWVADEGHDLPLLADGHPDPTAQSGRGLLIIAAIADRWGIDPAVGHPGKVVWFELSPA